MSFPLAHTRHPFATRSLYSTIHSLPTRWFVMQARQNHLHFAPGPLINTLSLNGVIPPNGVTAPGVAGVLLLCFICA